MQFRVTDTAALDRHSRRLLERFPAPSISSLSRFEPWGMLTVSTRKAPMVVREPPAFAGAPFAPDPLVGAGPPWLALVFPPLSSFLHGRR